MTSQIENFFVEIENLIKLQKEPSEVEQKFKDGKRLINELEEDDKEQYGRFRYKYHIEHAIYLEAIDEIDKANKQKDLAKDFEKYIKNSEETDKHKTEPAVLFAGATLGNINQVSDSEENTKENSMQDFVEKHLKVIKNLGLEDKAIEDIRQAFGQFDKIPETFEDYQRMIDYEAHLVKVLSRFISEVFIRNDKEQLQNQCSENLVSLESLKQLAIGASYSKKISFIQFVLNSPNKKEILYSNISYTEEGISKRFRQLSLFFHPDKMSQTYTPYRLLSKDKNLGDDLFKLIQEYKENLLSELDLASKDEGGLTFHEKKANKLWKITIDLRNAAKGQWDKLKLLNKEYITKNYQDDELERNSMDHGIQACQEYRAACKIADKAKQLKKQAKLRSNMALCLYILNQFLEAQLYALSAIMLLVRNSHEITQQDLNEAKKIFDKVKGGDGDKESVKLKTEIDLKDNLDNTLALVKVMDRKFSYFEKKAFQSSIDDDIENLISELIFNPDRSVVRYQASNERILQAKKRAFYYKTAGRGIIGGIALSAAIDVYNVVFIFGITSIGAPIVLAGSLATLGLGIWGGKKLWKKGTDLLEEPKIRETLNQIMTDALKAYDNGEHQKFLDELSKEYAANTSLLKLEKRDDTIDPKVLIDKLLDHGFRSDGIAYLLNLLGEVLNGGKLKIDGKTKKDLKALAITVFSAVMNEKLKVEAKKLDDHVYELRKKSWISSFIKLKAKDFILFRDYIGIAEEYMDDAKEMSFESRLEEMCNISRINLAIIGVMNAGDKEEEERAIKTIKEIRESIKFNYQFSIGTFKWRLEVLDDFLWVINCKESQEESQEESPKTSPVTLLIGSNQYTDYLKYLYIKLKQASSKQEELHLYNNIAACHERLAEKEYKVDQVKGLCHWKAAQRNYESMCELDRENLDATLGFAKCLLKLSKYDQITKLSITSPGLTSLSEYWRFCSIAYRKQANYEKADECIDKALSINLQDKLAGEQKELLKKLSIKENNTTNYRIDCYEKDKETVRFEMDYLKNSHSDNSPIYNILSIDGGGIRGILPALWLSEIEHRSHRPISHLFNMIAGTSTGAIIASGLSAPFFELPLSDGEKRYDYSNLKPRVSASELLNLYRNKAEDLLVSKSTREELLDTYFGKIRSYKALTMLESEKKRLIDSYFDEMRIDQALTELVIPAVNSKQPYLFTRYDARIDKSKNETFVNTLMATTASPSFFPSFKIEGKGDFLDGGIYLNNPAMTAYNEAIRYKVANEKIFILSMGTGSFIPDPLDPGKYWDQLFWKPIFNEGELPAQEIETDSKMYSMIGDRYQRWQVWFEKPIGFVDYNSVPYLLELGYQYIEELDASDANPINKLVESFEKNFQ